MAQNLPKKLKKCTIKIVDYLQQCDNILPDNLVFKWVFPIQINKSPGFDGVGKTRSLHKPLLHISNLSIQKGVLPDEPKIAREMSIHKELKKLIQEIIGQSQFFHAFQKGIIFYV